MVQKILSDKVMNERTNGITLIILESVISPYCPLMFMSPGTFYRLHKKKQRKSEHHTSDFELEQIISGMRLKALASRCPWKKYPGSRAVNAHAYFPVSVDAVYPE